MAAEIIIKDQLTVDDVKSLSKLFSENGRFKLEPVNTYVSVQEFLQFTELLNSDGQKNPSAV